MIRCWLMIVLLLVPLAQARTLAEGALEIDRDNPACLEIAPRHQHEPDRTWIGVPSSFEQPIRYFGDRIADYPWNGVFWMLGLEEAPPRLLIPANTSMGIIRYVQMEESRYPVDLGRILLFNDLAKYREEIGQDRYSHAFRVAVFFFSEDDRPFDGDSDLACKRITEVKLDQLADESCYWLDNADGKYCFNRLMR